MFRISLHSRHFIQSSLSMGLTALLGSALLISASLLVPQPASAETTNCRVISSLPVIVNKSGAWCLQRDLYYPRKTGAAITITRHNVTIDLNGFRIFGNAKLDTEAEGIRMKKSNNVHITNGTIERFRVGISAAGGSNMRIDHMNIDQNRQYGIWQQSTSSNTIIDHTTVSRTGRTTKQIDPTPTFASSAGIMVGAEDTTSSGTVVSNCKVANTMSVGTEVGGGIGVYLGGSNLLVQNCHVTFDSDLAGDDGIGIMSYNGADPTALVARGNTVTTDGAGGWGILAATVKDNVVSGFDFDMDIVIDAGGNFPTP